MSHWHYTGVIAGLHWYHTGPRMVLLGHYTGIIAALHLYHTGPRMVLPGHYAGFTPAKLPLYCTVRGKENHPEGDHLHGDEAHGHRAEARRRGLSQGCGRDRHVAAALGYQRGVLISHDDALADGDQRLQRSQHKPISPTSKPLLADVPKHVATSEKHSNFKTTRKLFQLSLDKMMTPWFAHALLEPAQSV